MRVLFVRTYGKRIYVSLYVHRRVCVALALRARARACGQDMARAHEKMKCQGENAT